MSDVTNNNYLTGKMLYSSQPFFQKSANTIQFSDGGSQNYTQDAVNYMSQFEDKEGFFSTDALGQAFGVDPAKTDLVNNLDLNADKKVDLKEASLGLMMEDAENNGANGQSQVADGTVLAGEAKNFTDNLQQAASQGASGYKANQDTLNSIAKVVDSKQGLTKAVDQVNKDKGIKPSGTADNGGAGDGTTPDDGNATPDNAKLMQQFMTYMFQAMGIFAMAIMSFMQLYTAQSQDSAAGKGIGTGSGAKIVNA